MPNATLICESCKRPFQGRPNRLHCSVGCRRSLEMGRRLWDRKALIVRYLERNSEDPCKTKKQRAHWRKQFEDAQAKLPPRP